MMKDTKDTYGQQIDDALNKILNREPFSYNLNADPLYNQYKDQYTQLGQQAMMDTMGQAQAMTGGYGNSYAQSVGQQTYQGYMQGLTDKIPTLYQIALDKYISEDNQMRDNLNLMMQQENLDYGRFRDQVGDQQWRETFDYSKARDEIADQQWRDTFDYSKSRDQLSDQRRQPAKTAGADPGGEADGRDAGCGQDPWLLGSAPDPGKGLAQRQHWVEWRRDGMGTLRAGGRERGKNADLLDPISDPL